MARQGRCEAQRFGEVRRYGIPGALALAALVLVAGWQGALAATLGGLRSKTLTAQKTATGAITETFSYSGFTLLNNRSVPSGGTWTVTGGYLYVTGQAAQTFPTSGTLYATVPVATCNSQIGLDVSPSGNSVFGLLINATTGGTPATAVLYNNAGNGSITLSRVAANGARTTLATAGSVGGGNATRFLTARYYNGVYTVRVNNTQVLTYTVPAAERPAHEAACNVGVMADSGTQTPFDNLQVYAL